MKSILYRILFAGMILSLLFLRTPRQQVTAQETSVPSTDRPLIVVKSYYLDQDTISPGESFRLYLSVKNEGALDAHNLIFGFTGEDFLPQETGGVVAVGSLGPGGAKDISQPLRAANTLWGKTTGSVLVSLNYTGPAGEAFSETFRITLDVLGWSGNSATVTPTPTATSVPRAQLVVLNSSSDVDPLQPGTIFTLSMDVQNLGNGDALGVTMIIGGGSFGNSGTESTPQPGGVSGSGADLSTFAPIGSSNLQYLGDVPAGAMLNVSQQLIVNVSANPGAYTLKISFAYSNSKGTQYVDDQIITLLVYQLPQLDVSFYRDPGPISAMAPNTLPIQVTNLGRKSVVLGNMTVTAENAELMNNTSLVGTLDPGGYFPLDVMIIPASAGPMDIKVSIDYTDDFNTPRTYEEIIPIEVIEGAPPVPEGPGLTPGGQPGMEGVPVDMPAVEETFWQTALRFLKGLVGLDSAIPQPAAPSFEVPPEEAPPQEQPLPAQGGKG
jgi:hypothetical protein